MSDEPFNPKTVDASPTKRFFIDMLIKDIDLLDAITDLIDNSVDSAVLEEALKWGREAAAICKAST